MTVPVTKTSKVLNKIFKGRPDRLGFKLARVGNRAGRRRSLDTADKVWAKMEKYLRRGADIDRTYDGESALMHVCGGQFNEVARKLVVHGANINLQSAHNSSRTPLMYAAIAGDPDMVRFLLQHGANTNVKGWGDTALDCAIDACKPSHNPSYPKPATGRGSQAAGGECVKLLVEYGATIEPQHKQKIFSEAPHVADLIPEVKGALDMHAAVQRNDLPALRDLLVSGVSADCLKDYKVDTPLCHAAASGNLPMIELLLSGGASIELPSPVSQYTPLQAATFNGQKDAFVLLLKKGADAKAPCAVKYDDPTTLDDVAKHSVNPQMTEFVKNVLETIASAPPPVNVNNAIKVNKPLRIRQQTP
jgi:hypothetical protein